MTHAEARDFLARRRLIVAERTGVSLDVIDAVLAAGDAFTTHSLPVPVRAVVDDLTEEAP